MKIFISFMLALALSLSFLYGNESGVRVYRVTDKSPSAVRLFLQTRAASLYSTSRLPSVYGYVNVPSQGSTPVELTNDELKEVVQILSTVQENPNYDQAGAIRRRRAAAVLAAADSQSEFGPDGKCAGGQRECASKGTAHFELSVMFGRFMLYKFDISQIGDSAKKSTTKKVLLESEKYQRLLSVLDGAVCRES